MSNNKDLEDLTIAELRSEASKLRIPLTRDMNKSVIIEAIKQVKNSPIDRIVGAEDSDRPAPGYARIVINKDSDPKASNADVYCQINGYAVLIRRGIEVDVPIKIVKGVLNNAKMKVLREDQHKGLTDPERYYFEEVFSYPFNVVDINPGPDPRPGIEAAAAKRNAPRRRFHKENGYWPRPAELKDWLRNGGGKQSGTKE
jgi:bifunctional DNase/RNase